MVVPCKREPVMLKNTEYDLERDKLLQNNTSLAKINEESGCLDWKDAMLLRISAAKTSAINTELIKTGGVTNS